MTGREMDYIKRAFETNWIAPLGKNVDDFENAVKKFVDMPSALALTSGTAAIHLALKYLGVGSGDYVFCSDVTFAGSCNPIIYQNAIPVFIDSDLDTWCMSPDLLQRALDDYQKKGNLPKAVIVVDLYGLPAPYDQIIEICAHYGVPIIEDAAEALGASYKNQKCGSFGDLSVFSFNGNKIITTSGGGMVLAKDAQAVTKMRYWATQARENVPYYEHKDIGYNYRLSNVCAGIGCGQMEFIEDFVEARKRLYFRYKEGFKDLPVSLYPPLDDVSPNYWLTVMSVKEDCGVSVIDVMNKLESLNIESRPFWKSMHTQPIFSDYDFYASSGGKPVGEQLFETSMCLPSGSAMGSVIQDEVIKTIRKMF